MRNGRACIPDNRWLLLLEATDSTNLAERLRVINPTVSDAAVRFCRAVFE